MHTVIPQSQMLVEKIFDAKASNRVYAPMVATIYQELVEGRYGVGDRLPTEAQLREQFNISINSVRRGVELFVEEGILTRRRGSGMYVARIPTAVAPNVRRDTIAVLYETHLKTYHPYYSEMRKGINETLEALGWKVHQFPLGGVEPDWQRSWPDVFFPGIDLDMVRETIRTGGHLAGLIAPLNMVEELKELCGERIKLVTPGFTDVASCVGYNWQDELRQTIRLVLRKGARKLLLVGGGSQAATQSLVEQAAACEGIVDSALCAVSVTVPNSSEPVYSKRMHDAYQLTLEALEADAHLDGVVAASDFDAQGVLDALAVYGKMTRRRLPVAALVNKESRIHAQQTYATVVADGYQVGAEVVHLLHQKISEPEHAPQRVVLRGLVREVAE